MAEHSGSHVAEPLPPSVVEDLVDEPRRRSVLRHLAGRDEPVALTDLASAVGAAEAGTEPDALGPDRRREIREEIYQRHLPKLTATGVVEFDSMRGTLLLRDATVADRVE